MAQLQLGSGQQKKPIIGIVPPLQKTPEIAKPPTTPNMGIPSSIGNAALFAGGAAAGVVPNYTTPTPVTGNTQGLSASSIGSATQGVIPKTNTTAGSAQMPANNFSKNVVGGVVPSLGYGGANYGASQQDNFAINRNKYKLENDPNYKQSEIERAKQTIADRKAVGLGTADQEKYLRVNLGYDGALVDAALADPNAGLPLPMDYNALARAEFEAKLAESRSRADAEKAALKGAWDTSNQTLRDNRVLDDLKFQRNNSPFEGRTNYAEGLIGRERTQMDANSLNQYNASVSGIEQGYTDAQTEIEAQIAARAYTLEQEAIAKAQADAELTGIYNGTPTVFSQNQTFNQNLDTEKFALDQTKTNAELTGYLPNGQKTTVQQQKDLENLWEQADYTGIIPDALANLYGIPKGTQTQKAKEFAQENALKTSQEARLLENTRADNNRQSSSGSSGSPKPSDKGPTKNEIEAEMIDGLDALSDSDRRNALVGEKSAIIAQFGKAYYDRLFKSYFPNG